MSAQLRPSKHTEAIRAARDLVIARRTLVFRTIEVEPLGGPRSPLVPVAGTRTDEQIDAVRELARARLAERLARAGGRHG